ncbi:MAG: IMP cyclohydrolase [Solobacterium sp.]|nr:IMP cyclohydrolase [Solobacterium sp.]MBR3127480.1 IMP cyclohydrolase [Solobacterium sp.]
MNVYEVKDLAEVLGNNPYPGRGIILGTTPDGTSSVAAYFIMGRSINSRNRVFVEEPDGIRTEAFDPSLMQDPSLIIYHPVREADKKLIVTNGNQTDTIHDFLLAGRSFNAALRTRDFEPDAPNYTPRISGLVDEDGNYCLNILKSVDPNGTGCVRETFEYPAVAGLGHFLHTYETNGDPIPSFTGEPERVAILNDIQEFTDLIWNNLDEDNKISLFVRYTNLRDGWRDQRIINKNK